MSTEATESKRTLYIALLQDFHKKNNRVPGRREFGNKYRPIVKLFGSWNNAIKSAGFEVVRERGYTKAGLKKSLLEFYITNGRAPKTAECLKSNGLTDPKIYMKVFGARNWTEVLEQAGLDRGRSKFTCGKSSALILFVPRKFFIVKSVII